MNENRRTVRTYLDRNGRMVIAVPLAGNAGEARIHREDYEALAARGLAGSWYFNRSGTRRHGYVRTHEPRGNLVSIGPIVAGVKPYEHVHHLDGDYRNLKRGNLVVGPGLACNKRCKHYKGRPA